MGTVSYTNSVVKQGEKAMDKSDKDALSDKGQGRRKVLKAGAAAGVAAASAGGLAIIAGTGSTLMADVARATDRGARPEREDLILVNGRIHTMDDRNTIASAVTIRRGRFVDVGHGHHGGGQG